MNSKKAHQHFFERQSKKLGRQGARIPRTEAYGWYAAGTREEGQRGIWTFYAAVKAEGRRSAPMDIVTACNLNCPDACSLRVSRDASGALRIRGNPDHPFTRGFTCGKIRGYPRRLSRPDRIRTPLLIRKGDRVPVSWDEALDLCASKIGEFRKEPASILHIQGEGAKGVLKSAATLFFGLLGASTTRGALCDSAGIAASVADFGALDMNDVDDLVNARGIVNWGKDLSRASVHTAFLVRKARKAGARVFTVSPGGDGNGPFSDETLLIRPGTDRFLAAAVLRLFLDRGAVGPGLREKCRHFDALKKILGERSPEDFAGKCGVPLRDVERLFAFYREHRPTAALIGWGLQRYRFGSENVRWIDALAFLSGNVGIPGGGSSFNVSSRRNFNLDWAGSFDPAKIRSFLLPEIGREIVGAADPPVRMLWVNGTNVVNQAADASAVARAFEGVDFKVVVDAFPTDTAIRADLVLPCALNLEQEDIIGSFLHPYVQYARPAVSPPEGCRDDFSVLEELGRRLDPPVLIPPREECLRRSLRSPFLDVSLEELKERGFARARRGTVAFEGLRFAHPDGRYRLPEALHDEPPAQAGYPLSLLSLIRRDAVHSQIPPEEQECPPVVRVDRKCPVLGELDLAGEIHLVSPQGRMPVRLEIVDGLHPLAVLYRRGDWLLCGGGVNRLISAVPTDQGEGTAYYSQNVRLENAGRKGSRRSR
jgi:anaerobic selenocysteine-containing dehydrogenase